MEPAKPASPRILTINGGSSSIKFALFEAGDPLKRILSGGIERIGLPDATFHVKGFGQVESFSRHNCRAGSHRGSGRSDGLDRAAQRA